MSQPKRKYQVDSPINHNNKNYRPNDENSITIILTDEEAAPLLSAKAISNPQASTADEDSSINKKEKK